LEPWEVWVYEPGWKLVLEQLDDLALVTLGQPEKQKTKQPQVKKPSHAFKS